MEERLQFLMDDPHKMHEAGFIDEKQLKMMIERNDFAIYHIQNLRNTIKDFIDEANSLTSSDKNNK